MQVEYDLDENSFSYFIVPVYAFIILPILTCCFWPKTKENKTESHLIYRSHYGPYSNEYQLLHVNKPNQKRQAILARIGLAVAWIILVLLIYRVSLIKTKTEGYDPFVVLDVDQEASVDEIRQAYHELGRKHHPDRGGDPEKFKEIAKAYRTLSNKEANENWRKYGNPDGPKVIRIGYAVPKWSIDPENSTVILLTLTVIFAIILPVIVIYLLK